MRREKFGINGKACCRNSRDKLQLSEKENILLRRQDDGRSFFMEKILIVASHRHFMLYKKGIENYAEKMNLSIDLFYADYYDKPDDSVIAKLKYKLNFNDFKKKYYSKVRNSLCEVLDDYEQILFLNVFFDEEYFIQGELQKKLAAKVCKVLFVDSIRTIDQKISFWDAFTEIYSFEFTDIEYAKQKFGVDVKYVPIGTSYKSFGFRDGCTKKIYDICFVGIGGAKRVQYLEKIAAYAQANNKKFFVSGHFWHNSNQWNKIIGKLKFKLKHPLLAKYVQNIFIEPENLAAIYRQSKIVLNINMEYHKSFNQRAFDIMVCDSLLICDRQNLNGLAPFDGDAFVMCDDADAMIEKIKYFLEHDDERIAVSANGKRIAEENYLIDNTLDTVLNGANAIQKSGN